MHVFLIPALNELYFFYPEFFFFFTEASIPFVDVFQFTQLNFFSTL